MSCHERPFCESVLAVVVIRSLRKDHGSKEKIKYKSGNIISENLCSASKKSKLLLGITGPKNRVHECYTNSYVDEINSLRFKYLYFHRGTGSLEKMQEDLFLFKCF